MCFALARPQTDRADIGLKAFDAQGGNRMRGIGRRKEFGGGDIDTLVGCLR